MEFSSLLLFLILAFVFILIMDFLYKYHATRRGKQAIPSRMPLPLIGNAYHFLKASTSTALFTAVRTFLPDAPLAAVWLAHKLVVMVHDARYIDLLVSKGVASQKADELYSIFDDVAIGVFATRDKKMWLEMRKPLDKIMHPKFLPNWYQIFANNCEKIIEKLKTKKGVFDIQEDVFMFTLENVMESHMGVQDISTLVGIKDVYDNLHSVIALLSLRSINAFHRIDVIYRLTENYRNLKLHIKTAMKTFTDIFEKRQKYLKKNGMNVVDVEDDTCTYSDIILRYATAGNKQLNFLDATKMGNDFVVAASHTPSSTLSSALLLLAMHPEYQEKIYQETQEFISGTIPTIEELESMEFLDRVVKESIRITGVPGLGRVLSDDVEVDGYFLSKNTILFVNYAVFHRYPKYWERPNDFYPDHFLPEAVKKRPKSAFIPFSIGSRTCAGRLYGLIAMKIALAMLIRRFKFITKLKYEELQLKLTIVIVPDVFDMEVHERI